MTELNLTANGSEQERILAYLKEHASEALAEKINRGTVIEKDGKRLLNKKMLDGFMKYACDEARKQTAKGANGIMLDDSVVFGWAIHYFEEPDIEGTLYTEDGREYRLEPIKNTASAPVAPKQKQQLSLFEMPESTDPQTDLLAPLESMAPSVDTTEAPDDDTLSDEDLQEFIAESTEPKFSHAIDRETGEVLAIPQCSVAAPEIADDPLAEERAFAKAYDPDVVCQISELLGEIFILE